MDHVSLKFTVTGKVQGVGFRSHVKDSARLLGITGEVWNEKSGSGISGVIVGEKDKIARFQDRLTMGPGRIDNVDYKPVTILTPYGRFMISRSR